MRFTPDQVLEIEGIIEKTVLSRMAENTARDFTAEELEEINIKIKYFCAPAAEAAVGAFSCNEIIRQTRSAHPCGQHSRRCFLCRPSLP